MRHSTIKQRLFLLVAVPLVALAITSISLVRSAYTGYQGAQQTQAVLEVAVAASTLVHTLQVERGMSVGFLQSKGQKFADTLPTARGKSDDSRKSFDAIAAQEGIKALGQLRPMLDTAVEKLDVLGGVRARIDKQELPIPEVVTAYTQAIAALTAVIASSGDFNSDAAIAQQSMAYLALVKAKEYAGQERALVTAAFAADAIEPARLHAVLERINKQEAYFDIFRGAADKAELAELDKALGGDPAKEVGRMRAVLIEKSATGGFGIEPTQWFSTATAKIEGLLQVETLAAKNIDAGAAALVSGHRNTLYGYLALCLISLGVVVWVSLWVAGGVSNPLREQVRVAEQAIAGNDFTHDVPENGPIEVVRAGHAFNQLMAKFREILSEMRMSSGAVTEAALALAESSQKVQESSAAQTDATSAVAAAVEQASVSVSETSMNAQMAAEEVARARDDTDAAMRVMNEAVGNMRAIAGLIEASSQQVTGLSDDSQRIGGIVQVIREIADQTNLLALNAAIEAARAGEQGRGFAVVADEVRKLAERTGSATSEIGSMIDAIQRETSSVVETMQAGGDKVVQGVKLADEAAAALEKINAQTLEAVASVNAIASATREQQAASSDIARNVERIAQMTEESGAAAHHSADAAQNLERLATGLQARVGRFKL